MASPSQKMPFPTGGVNSVAGFDMQPPGTTPDALNVRGFDVIEERLRGGRRAGLSKFVDFDFGSAIQAITAVSQATVPAGTVGAPEDVVFDTAPASNTNDMGDGWLQINFFGNTPQSDTQFERKTTGTVETAGTSGDNTRVAIIGVRPMTKVTVTGSAVPQANPASSKIDQESTLYACFLRANIELTETLVFSLEYVSSNVVRPHVYSVVTSNDPEESQTDLWTGSNLTLSGGATASDLSLTFEHLGGTSYRVQGTWDSESWSLDETISVSALNDSDNVLGGFGATRHTATTRKVVYTAATGTMSPAPSIGSILQSIDSSDDNTVGTNRYFIPNGVTSLDYDRGSDTFDSSDEGAAEDSSEFRGLCIDTSNEVFAGSTDPTGADDLWGCVLTENPSQRPILGMAVESVPGVDHLFYFRVSDDFRSYVVLRMRVETSASGTNQIDVADTNIAWQVVDDGSVVNTGFTSISHERPFRRDDFFEVVDPGEDGDTDIVFRVEGVTLHTETIPASAIGSSAAPGLYDGSGNSYRRCGFGWDRNGASDFSGTLRWTVGELQPEGGETPLDATRSDSTLIAVAGGDVYAFGDGDTPSVATGGSDAVRVNVGRVAMQSAFGKTYIVDGLVNREYDAATDTVSTWTASAGSLPTGASLIALYRGRVVLSGSTNDPHNWFMSRLGDPDDWNYTPSDESDPTNPVAGNNSPAGKVGDIVTALIPFSDDAMLMGGVNSIWQMTGDPAAGGAIDLVTDKTGIAFGLAWTRSPDNTVYFMGTDGVYRTRLGAMPENITRDRLDSVFRGIDLQANRVMLEWDYQRHGLYVMVMPATSNVVSTAYFYEARTDAWWPDDYNDTTNPTFLYAYDGPAADDKAMLFGGRDGYIRQVDNSAADDDGDEITSRVRFAQLLSTDPSREILLNELYPVMASNSGAVDLSVYSGQTAEEVVNASSPRFKRSLSAGRNASIRQKVRGAALQVELSQTGSTRWALEGLSAVVRNVGKARRHAN